MRAMISLIVFGLMMILIWNNNIDDDNDDDDDVNGDDENGNDENDNDNNDIDIGDHRGDVDGCWLIARSRKCILNEFCHNKYERRGSLRTIMMTLTLRMLTLMMRTMMMLALRMLMVTMMPMILRNSGFLKPLFPNKKWHMCDLLVFGSFCWDSLQHLFEKVQDQRLHPLALLD